MTKKPNIQYIAAKALIRDKKGKVLVLKQSDPTITGDKKYHPPGGIVELGETLQMCLAREVKEEIGLGCQIIGLFDVGEWSAERGKDIMQFVGLYYICTIENKDLTIQASEASDALWVGMDDIEDVDILEPSKTIIRKLLANGGH